MTRRLTVLLILASFVSAAAFGQTPPSAVALGLRRADPFQPGKSLHFLGGLTLGLAAAGIADLSSDPQLGRTYPLLLPLVALSASAVGGTAKEILDSTGFGDPRFTDILITMSGGLAAGLAVGYAEGLYPASRSGQVNGASFLISMAVGASIPVVIGFIGEMRSYVERRVKESQ